MRGRNLLLLAVLSACTAASTVTTATTTSVNTTTTTSVLSPEEATSQFQLCLSGYSVETEVPLGDDGRPDLTALEQTLRDDLTAMRIALTSCAAHLAASGALDLSDEPVLREAVRTHLTNFSICMRSQGVDDFPDPVPDFDGTGLPYPIADLPMADPEFGSAIEACTAAVGVAPLRR